MSLNQDIEQNLIQALKDKDQSKVSVLRMLKSALHNQVIALKKGELTEEEVTAIIRQELKKRQDSIAAYTEAQRKDLADQEKIEADILSAYLPAMLSEEEVTAIVDQVIASGIDNFGQAMKEVMNQTKGRADGQLVQQLVKSKLNN
jgi:uncharacterized protein